MLSKNTFSTEHLQTTAFEFLQNDIGKFIDCQTNEKTKKIHIRRKKAKHGTERNELKCQLLKAYQQLIRVKAVGCFCRGAPSMMFGGIVDATLSKKVSTTGATHKNLELSLVLLIQTKHKTIK